MLEIKFSITAIKMLLIFCIEIIVVLNSFITTFSQNGLTPLIFAALNGRNEAVKILVQHGAGVNMQDVVSTLYSDILLP